MARIKRKKCKMCGVAKASSKMTKNNCKECSKEANCANCGTCIGDDDATACPNCNKIYHRLLEDTGVSCVSRAGGCCKYCIHCLENNNEKPKKATKPTRNQKLYCKECWDNADCTGCYDNIHRDIDPDALNLDDDIKITKQDCKPMVCDECKRPYHTLCYQHFVQDDLSRCCLT